MNNRRRCFSTRSRAYGWDAFAIENGLKGCGTRVRAALSRAEYGTHASSASRSGGGHRPAAAWSRTASRPIASPIRTFGSLPATDNGRRVGASGAREERSPSEALPSIAEATNGSPND